MPTYLNLIKKLIEPSAIPSAQRARTMLDLVTSFRNDALVQRLLKAGRHNHEGRQRVDEEGLMLGRVHQDASASRS